MIQILFRADASIQIGSGHLMRCLTLAHALKAQGYNCGFICQNLPGHLVSLISEQGFKACLIPVCQNEQSDAASCLELIKNPVELLVIDHYQLGRCYEQLMRGSAKHIMVIDDLANRTHDADLLLDQNLLPQAELRYSNLVDSNCILLAGPGYALLRTEFYQVQPEQRQRLLVNFGGTDPDNLTLLALDALDLLKSLSIHADIVIGQSHPAADLIRQRCEQQPLWQFHRQCNYMARLMQQARLMLGAGGSTHWERCFSALPALVVTVADNQRQSTEYLNQLGACIWLGDAAKQTKDKLAQAIAASWQDEIALQQMAKKASGLLPRNAGTPAVVKAITELMRF